MYKGKKEPYKMGIEGIDGSGKGTQGRKLYKRLVEEGYKVKLVDFPNYGEFYGKEIGRLLSGKDKGTASNTEPKSMSLWYALDRKETFDKIVDMSNYDIILMNRSTYSNIGYQTARLGDRVLWEGFIAWLKELEYDKLGIPKADRIYFCDIDVETSGKNVEQKGEREYIDGKDVYEAEETFLNTVQDVYRLVSKEDEVFQRISCLGEDGKMRGIEEIHEEIYKQVIKDINEGNQEG